ncbi:MAG: hypothetical protein HKL90_09705 [Elusimicrobia bacterium]|nr:hypothetical protein [Elusimicrobiota bacterium]
MPKEKLGSPVLRAFIAPAPPCGEDFAQKALPREWKARLLFADPIDWLEHLKRSTACVSVRLEDFRYKERFEEDSLEFVNSMREPLTVWLARIDGVEYDRVFSSAANPDGAHWRCPYMVGSVSGEFKVWILPVSETTAHLVADITEYGG